MASSLNVEHEFLWRRILPHMLKRWSQKVISVPQREEELCPVLYCPFLLWLILTYLLFCTKSYLCCRATCFFPPCFDQHRTLEEDFFKMLFLFFWKWRRSKYIPPKVPLLVSCRAFCTVKVWTTKATSVRRDTAAVSLSAAATTMNSGVSILLFFYLFIMWYV